MQAEEAWVKVRLEVVESALETAVALLWIEGAGSVEEQDSTTLASPDDPLAADRGRAVAFFGGEPIEALHQRVAQAAQSWGLSPLALTVEPFTDESWKENWKQFFKPTRISPRLAVRPPWETYEAPEGVEVLVIEPGLAFGTGTHATTQLCLAWLDDLCADIEPANALDVGCGSGILSIGVAKLTQSTAIVGVDIDPEAQRVARENIEKAGQTERITIASANLGAMEDTFELVVANILSHILLRLAQDLAQKTAPGGRLLLSGIGESSEAEIVAGFAEVGMTVQETRRKDGWVAVLMARTTPEI